MTTRLNVFVSAGDCVRRMESGGKPPHSKTLPRLSARPNLRQLLECGDLPALSIWQRDNLFNSSARQRNGALRTAPPYQF
jgi:hypothetical protein